MKKPIKSKHIEVQGFVQTPSNALGKFTKFDCIVTNDDHGKTLSINNGLVQFTIPFKPLERWLK